MFSTFACLRKLRDISGRSEEHRIIQPQTSREQRAKEKNEEQASSSVPTGLGQTDDKRSTSPEARLATGAQIPCLWGARCRTSSCDYRHPPVCRNHKSGNRCIHGNTCLYRHADGEEKPSMKSKKESTQGAVAILKKKGSRLCISRLRSSEFHST